MKNKILYLSFSLTLLSTGINASTLRGEESYWQCQSSDIDKQVWLGKSSYKRKALNNSFNLCKNESKLASSCQTSYSSCSMVIKGKNLVNNWQCAALDTKGDLYQSDSFDTRNNAYEGAKSICKQLSPFPSTCYVRLFTCENNAL